MTFNSAQREERKEWCKEKEREKKETTNASTWVDIYAW